MDTAKNDNYFLFKNLQTLHDNFLILTVPFLKRELNLGRVIRKYIFKINEKSNLCTAKQTVSQIEAVWNTRKKEKGSE